MSLLAAPRIARRYGLLLVPLFGLPWLASALGLLAGLRGDLGITEPALGEAAGRLLFALASGGFVATELLVFGLGCILVRRAETLAQVAAAGAARDFRHAPAAGDADELDGVASAFGRMVRHLTQRRRELDWMAADLGRPRPAAEVAKRIGGLLAPVAGAARFAPDDPEPATPWLHPPRHRLLCALAGAAAVLAAAPVAPAWWAVLAGATLFGGRLLERLRGLGWALIPAIATLALAAVLTHPPGNLVAASLATLAASVAVHFGGGWRGPAGGAADAIWLRGGFAGAVAGGGAALAALTVIGPAGTAALGLPALLVVLGVLASCLAPAPATATPADWLSVDAALRVLRYPAARRQLLGAAFPGGLALGAAISLAARDPGGAVAAAVVATAALALAALGDGRLGRPRRWPGLLALAGAAALAGHGETLAGALLASIGAAGVWPLATAEAAGGTAPRQAAILGALLRGVGVLVALAVAPLLPAGGPAALACLLLIAGAWPARRG